MVDGTENGVEKAGAIGNNTARLFLKLRQFKINYTLGILWLRPVHTRGQRRWIIVLRMW